MLKFIRKCQIPNGVVPIYNRVWQRSISLAYLPTPYILYDFLRYASLMSMDWNNAGVCFCYLNS